MAIRKIREFGDNVLRKQCKEVKEVTGRVRTLVEDMIDTMYEVNGVGLAAPQVGVMKRIVVIDVGDGPIVFINPKILESDGEQFGTEGCLSLPGKMAYVRRPNHVKACAYDIDMNYFEIEGEELLARAICHELDHLDGVLYIDRMEGELLDNTYVPEEE